MGVASFQTGASRPCLRHNPLSFVVLALFLASVGPPYLANALKPYSTCRLNSRPGDSCPAVRRNNEGKCIAHAEFQQRGDDWCLLPLGDVSRERGQHLAALVARNQRRKRKGKYLEMMMERVNSPNVFRQAHDFHHYTIHKENTLGLHMVENSSNPFQGVHVPDEDIQSSFDFRTCAVVGSSDNLLATQYGMQIDNHTTIIRFNNAPTKGFELHVGSRTDIRITNSGFSFFSENGSRETCLVRPRIGFYERDRATAERLTSQTAVMNPCRRVMISPQYEAYRRGLWGRLITGAHPNWSSGENLPIVWVVACIHG
mmetsp:Transcript_23898/g.42524  ORF Transcript_23898/g.42524 Transcript_23898/m.42524 type:complete len:314 (-) Transcript_23898:597-1538(-)